MAPKYLLDDRGKRGVELFNAGEYYRCHDAFEEVWMEKKGEEKSYYQGLIQISVALYKVRIERNWRGATSLLRTGAEYLSHVKIDNIEIDINELSNKSNKLLEILIELGPERIDEVPASLFPKIKYIS